MFLWKQQKLGGFKPSLFVLRFLYLFIHCSGLGGWFVSLKSFLVRLMLWKGIKRTEGFLNI